MTKDKNTQEKKEKGGWLKKLLNWLAEGNKKAARDGSSCAS